MALSAILLELVSTSCSSDGCAVNVSLEFSEGLSVLLGPGPDVDH